MIRDDATEAQVRAAHPSESTWLSANAGSGKTRVLTDRVARLLLNKVSPSHILCLTYTKAAASEMQNRLFRRLGEWAMLDDAALSSELDQLGVESALDEEFLQQARTLFARAIETPGGLRIQTIHSFCAALLRRFPLEAGISPQFKEMEDRAAILLQAEVVDALALSHPAEVTAAAWHFSSDDDLESLTKDILQHRTALSRPLAEPEIKALYGLDPDTSRASIAQTVFLGGEAELLAELVSALRSSSAMDLRAVGPLGGIGLPDFDALPVMEGVFLTGAGAKDPFTAKIGTFPTKGLQKSIPHLMPRLEDLMRRVESAREERLALLAAEKTHALHRFAALFLPKFDAAKQRKGWLDFDDLIFKARALLNDPKVAAWVLYKLDGGIDHILVDEAQDTSPVQWQIIERLAQEFTAGVSARSDHIRTVFVVGDRKQSIYSFQGADPREFDRMRDEFEQRLAASPTPLQSLTLQYSFRSATPVLQLVDKTFEGRNDAGFGEEAAHRAFKSNMPGRVDLWPVVERNSEKDETPWYEPLDRPGTRHHTVTLAGRIAGFIHDQIGQPIAQEIGNTGQYQTRQIHAGDFLILVQRRGPLFQEIIRACKAGGLPIAGADRLKVGAELAVRDLAAVLKVLATPEDSLSLAEALKSPLFGWTEQQVFDLAHRRDGPFLWAALRKRRDEFPNVWAVLNDLMGKTDFLRPYDLIERILTRHDGRRKLLARLGEEAEDGINALLSQALGYEQSDIPSLTGFLQWMQTDDFVIKRQADSAGKRIRVMTVHGAKGLEAPIVMLPDSGQRIQRASRGLLKCADTVIWPAIAAQSPALQSEAQEAERAAQRNERDRLLYVAMTRAEKWLIVAAAGELGKDGEAWHDRVRVGMENAGAEPHGFDFGELGSGPGLRMQTGDWESPPQISPEPSVSEAAALPSFMSQPAPLVIPPAETLSPSDLGGAKALPGEAGLDEETAKALGSALHLLLEHLPIVTSDLRAARADRLLARAGEILLPEHRAQLVQEALYLLDTPELAHLFGEGTLAEVPITATLHALGGRRIHGVIDRLIITPQKITAVDFKTNRTVPDSPENCPDGLLRQMGAYAAALEEIYPNHQIETGILWTAVPRYMPLPNDMVSVALYMTATS
ncbi:double-strand break repair helicase AddA [Primorskyibacter flagellatus]|uniref:double-strand break repair helicase AddA n=1 Tax=Primorskyibacter flagellatus TaxID=1387277 RepID=UPI003A8FCF37